MPSYVPASDGAKARAIIDDIEGEVLPWVERLDIETLLRAAQFEATEYHWGWVWEHWHHNLKYTTFKGTNESPTTQAKWLVEAVKRLELLP